MCFYELKIHGPLSLGKKSSALFEMFDRGLKTSLSNISLRYDLIGFFERREYSLMHKQDEEANRNEAPQTSVAFILQCETETTGWSARTFHSEISRVARSEQ